MTETARKFPKLMLVGHGRAGKDEAGEYLARITPLRFAGTTSKYLAKYVAREMGVTEEAAYRDRHQNRDEWYRIGNELRANDPGILIRESLQNGEIIGGIRDMEEVQYARREGIVDLIVWIENMWVPFDPTVKFTPRECDIVLQNNWTLADYHERLRRLADCLGIRKTVADKTRDASAAIYADFLLSRGWVRERTVPAMEERWCCGSAMRQHWHPHIVEKHLLTDYWTRDEALALQREIEANPFSPWTPTPKMHPLDAAMANPASPEHAYLIDNGWELLMLESESCETWAPKDGVKAKWPDRIRVAHGGQIYWDRAEAAELQREIDKYPGAVRQSGQNPARSGHELEQQGAALGALNIDAA